MFILCLDRVPQGSIGLQKDLIDRNCGFQAAESGSSYFSVQDLLLQNDIRMLHLPR